MNQLLKKFKSDIVGLVYLAGAVFLGLALFSFNPLDPSFNSIGNSIKASNYCGYFGSFLADLAYQGLGFSSWIIVIGLGLKSFRCFVDKSIKPESFPYRWLWTGLLFITSCSIVTLYFPEVTIFKNKIPAGGFVGIIVSSAIVKVFNFGGAAILLWTAAAILVVFYTEQSLIELGKNLKFKFSSMFLKMQSYFQKAKEKLNSYQDEKQKNQPQIINTNNKAKEKSLRSKHLFKLKESQDKNLSENIETRFLPIINEQDESIAIKEDDEAKQPLLKGFFVKKESPKSGPIKRKPIKAIDRIENWDLPKLSFLNDPPASHSKVDEKDVKTKAKILVDKLSQFSVRGSVVGIKPGPAITLFEFKPAADVKISKITDLADDLSLALSSESVRIIAPIPGRDVVGIETSNPNRDTVYLKDLLNQETFWDEEIKLPVALGRQADGEPKVVDLRKMPHLLVAGSTGSGKSVFVVSLLAGLLFRHSPKSMRLILVDPKQVDLAAFGHCPHLLMPPIREAQKAVVALKWAIREMDKRYRSMSKFGARGLEAFNETVISLSADEKKSHEEYNSELTGAAKLDDYYFEPLPYIVIVVEEFGDLMAVDKANVEHGVVRLAQMARACGIHLILAMQSPRRDVVTGLIKTNIPGRISFKVASKMDSRIILDESGAERLLTRGDMLYLAPGVSKPERHHGAYLSEEELSKITKHWSQQGQPEFDEVAMKFLDGSGGGFEFGNDQAGGMGDDIYDERYDEILSFVSSQEEVSASLIQRRFRIGYPRAARLIEVFESEGVVGPANGSKPRQVLVGAIKA